MEEAPLEFQEGVPQERIDYYKKRVEKLLMRNGHNFTEFVRNREYLIDIGDELLRNYGATGFNILHKRSNMPLTSDKPLIFYSNYIGRPQHFGIMLAEWNIMKLLHQTKLNLG